MSENSKNIKITTDNNVYILGAGFSRIAGLPLVKDFMSQMRDTYADLQNGSMEGFSESCRTRSITAIENILKYRLEASTVNYRVNVDLENIEQLFSLAAFSFEDKALFEDIRIAICATLHRAETRYNKIDPANNPRFRIYTPNHEKQHLEHIQRLFRKHVISHDNPGNQAITMMGAIVANLIRTYTGSEGNQFITLNYDTLLEQGLDSIGISAFYGLSKNNTYNQHDKKVNVYKLHGSSNWARDKKRRDHIIIKENFDAVFEDPECENSPCIIPPTANKSHDKIFRPIWKGAIEAIRQATRIIVIGYSFPKTDNHINYLIAEGLRHNVSLKEIHICDVFPEQVERNWELSDYSKKILVTTKIEDSNLTIAPSSTTLEKALLVHSEFYSRIGRQLDYHINQRR